MLLSWFRDRRRQTLLAAPFPTWWEGFLAKNVAHYGLISPTEQTNLRNITRILIAEKQWQGCGSLFVTEEMKVTIAAQAALLLLGNDHRYFQHVRKVVVFPTEFRTPVAEDGWEDDGLSETPLAGRAVDRGPVLLAWDEVLPEGRNPSGGVNVVIHEFAHQLDFSERLTTRAPPLGDGELESRWQDILTTHFEQHHHAISRGKRNPLFTAHAADSLAEYFANACEAFYCRPATLKQLYPEVYRLLAAYFKVDPLAWFGRRG
ncbi:MAG: hypothetical protein C0467_00955 [Planctomycetaceae bacterium]|nr:hypothetical protein [Planctomycetaceae bacterium]